MLLFRSSDGALGRLFDRMALRSLRQKGTTAFMHGTAHDNEAAFRQQGAKTFVRCWFLCVDPNHHHSARVEEIRQPVHRRLKRVKRASPPIHKRNVVLTGWTAAIARRCRQQISVPVNSSIYSMLFEPATTMRWRVEQPASAIIGSIILSPVAS